MPTQRNYLDTHGLTLYDTKIKEWVEDKVAGAEPESATEEDINNVLGLPNWELVWANIRARNNDTIINRAEYLLKRTLGANEDYIAVVSLPHNNEIHIGYVTVDENDQITGRGEEISDITVSATPSEVLADAESCAASVTLDEGLGSTTLTGTATITREIEEVLGG